MSKEINDNKIDLTKILRVGDKVYSPICGECEVIQMDHGFITVLNPIKTITLSFCRDGKYHVQGECILFPSRDQRDWSKFTRPRWRAEKGERYFYIVASYLNIGDATECGNAADEERHYIGNYFKSNADALKAVQRIKELLKQIHEEDGE